MIFPFSISENKSARPIAWLEKNQTQINLSDVEDGSASGLSYTICTTFKKSCKTFLFAVGFLRAVLTVFQFLSNNREFDYKHVVIIGSEASKFLTYPPSVGIYFLIVTVI